MLNWTLPIGAFEGQWNTITTEKNIQQQLLRIPTGPEANQLAIYK